MKIMFIDMKIKNRVKENGEFVEKKFRHGR
jgi:hypothetical protein